MEISFSGKRALVTGAGKGIGRDLAKALDKCGAQVVALSRTQADLDSLKEEVPSIETVCVDVSDVDTAQSAVESVGQIDVLVNNAGTNVCQSFLDVTPEAFDKLVAVNLKAPLFISQTVAKGMVSRGNGGSIVNISSQASQAALQAHTVYSATKGGLDMMSKVMAFELGPHKIRVNTVNPTVCLTTLGRAFWTDPARGGPMLAKIPLGRFAEVEDVVNAVLFLLSDQAAMINGVTLPVDGGFLAT